ncbi:hypothetical protein BJ956_002539 [Arthrobacter psychrochitiniphilus]|nr:hypothetical protein [Arthrobacter psychrochitiniphilus]NYG18020.1 hypothetical protein [Arthrobacter psychrochitiniphilus]
MVVVPAELYVRQCAVAVPFNERLSLVPVFVVSCGAGELHESQFNLGVATGLLQAIRAERLEDVVSHASRHSYELVFAVTDVRINSSSALEYERFT